MLVKEKWLGWGPAFSRGLLRGEDTEFTVMVAGLDTEQGGRAPQPGWHHESQVLSVWCVRWGWVGDLAPLRAGVEWWGHLYAVGSFDAISQQSTEAPFTGEGPGSERGSGFGGSQSAGGRQWVWAQNGCSGIQEFSF